MSLRPLPNPPEPTSARPGARRLLATLIGLAGVCVGSAQAQQVAVLDSGVDPSRGFNVVGGFNYFLDNDDTSDGSTRPGEGHGTVSVRAISEAFSGEIVPFVVTDGGDNRIFEDRVRSARDSALADILGRDSIRVVALTWGTAGITGAAAPLMPELTGANKVVAIMAGNDTRSQPNALATGSFSLAGVIIVGGGDANGNLLPEANRAGTTANKYVVANGLPNPDATVGGASWAAARIAGIAGAVLLQNPNLTAAEVVDVILQSAVDRGEAGTDAEFGRGAILNAQQVLNNVIGPVTVPTTPEVPASTGGGGGGGGGGGAALLLGGALAGVLLLNRKPKDKLEKTLVLDSYGRAFELDLNPHIAINDGQLHLNDFFHSLQQDSVADGIYLPELRTEVAFAATTNIDHRFDMIEYFAMPGDIVIEDKPAEVSMALSSRLTDSLELNAGYRVSGAQRWGAVNQLDNNSQFGHSAFISGQSFDSLLSGFSRQANTASLAWSPEALSKASLKMGLVSVDQKQRFGQESFSSILEGRYQFTENAGLSMQFGQIEEQGSLFGGAAGGIFGVETATTYALNIGGSIKASDKISIVGNYGVGRTHVDASEDSLLNDFSSLRSDWYSLGLVGNNLFRQRDQMGLAWSQPLKIRSGGVDYSIPTGRAGNGAITFDTERVNLSETGATERALEGYYRTMLSDKMELGSFISYRQNPNHFADNGDELMVMATLRFWQ